MVIAERALFAYFGGVGPSHIWSYGHVLYPCMSGGARVGPSRGAGVGLCHYVSVIPIYGHMTMCYTHILAGLDPREGQV